MSHGSIGKAGSCKRQLAVLIAVPESMGRGPADHRRLSPAGTRESLFAGDQRCLPLPGKPLPRHGKAVCQLRFTAPAAGSAGVSGPAWQAGTAPASWTARHA